MNRPGDLSHPAPADAAQRAYEAFCASFGRLLPAGTPTWDELPEKLQTSWRAAAAAARN